MITYLSGPMTGLPNLNRQAFKSAERRLKRRFTVLNPSDITISPQGEYGDYLREALKMLLSAEAIYMLPGWRASNGARVEYMIARAIGMKVMYGEEKDNK